MGYIVYKKCAIMNNLKSFYSFLNEDDYSYSPLSAEDRIRAIRKRIEAQTPEEKVYQTVYDEGGAAGRLLSRTINAITGVSRGIADVFKKEDISKMDDGSLEKNRDEILSKWGDGIRASGRNKQKDYEEFYTDAVIKGKKTFGGKYDINNPKNREERIYSDYISGAEKYFDV